MGLKKNITDDLLLLMLLVIQTVYESLFLPENSTGENRVEVPAMGALFLILNR